MISVMVVNWNGRALLADCLQALDRQTYHDREIILIDNGSTDASVRFVAEHFPHVKILQLGINKGFTGGNLEGLTVCRGEFIALLNNDTKADEKWLEHLAQPMLTDPRIGMCASKILVFGTGVIDSAGDGVSTAGVGFKRGSGQPAHRFSSSEDVFGACAAAALYRKAMLEDIGFFDDDFFLNDEDADLNFRAQLVGWTCRYVPTAVVQHRVNATIGRLSNRHVYYHSRNLEFLWIKNMPAGLMLRYAPHKLVQEVGSFCYLCLRHGKWSAFLRAKRDAIRMLPVMLKKRRELQSQRRVSNQYIKGMMTPISNPELVRQKLRQLIFR